MKTTIELAHNSTRHLSYCRTSCCCCCVTTTTMAPVKRALSSYMIFCNDRRKQVTEANPGALICSNYCRQQTTMRPTD